MVREPPAPWDGLQSQWNGEKRSYPLPTDQPDQKTVMKAEFFSLIWMYSQDTNHKVNVGVFLLSMLDNKTMCI